MYQLLILSQRIVLLSGAWAFLSIILLAFIGSLSVESFFVLCLLGFFTILLLFGPAVSRPGWRTRAGIVVSIGVLIFGLLIVNRLLAILRIAVF